HLHSGRNVKQLPDQRRCPIITNHVEVDTFWRCLAYVGGLTETTKGVLHIGIRLRTGIALPVAKIEGRGLVEINDGRVSAVDRKITRAGCADVPDSGRGPAK